MDPIAEKAVELAAQLAVASAKVQTLSERRELAQLARMMNDKNGKTFTLMMVDRVFRSLDPARQAARLRGILAEHGTPRFLSPMQRLLLRSGAIASRFAPATVMKLIEQQLRQSSARVILPGETERLHQYLRQRKEAGTRVNLNHLGEAVLGEEEAARRLQAILDHLADPLVDYISVKLSAIFSQVNIIDWDHTLCTVKDRLRILYRVAQAAGKFVNLDMEEYRDLEITVAVFQQVLDEDEFKKFTAGLALQAYVPDSWEVQQRLTQWAKARVQSGGAPIKIRLVKGANLAMEQVEAELHGWNSAPYSTKNDTDANYRRMLEFGCQPANARAVRIGVASHNLFDVALGMVLREELGVQQYIEFEMLEGMANHQARVVQQRANGLLVYAPAVKRADFFSAMAYLVRRLDENTNPGNFLHDLFGLEPASPAWEQQKQRFIQGWEHRNAAPRASNRATPKVIVDDGQFHNAPDTDWTQKENRCRLTASLKRWTPPAFPPLDPLNDVLDRAVVSQPGWGNLGYEQRSKILRHCAEMMESQRFDSIAQMVHEGKKAAVEADAEVSEAVDFARYVASTAQPSLDVRSTPLGVVVITPPWNFPYTIPCSGVVAALIAGNAVILKPAPQTEGVAWKLAEQLWDGGVPRDVLQFFPCSEDEVGKSLITDPRVSAVVLTGAYETAKLFLSWRPSLKLFAETSGKNAITITAQADRDLAIKDLVKSAFGHAGQKCSAASLAILEAEVYDDVAFRRALRDAAASLKVGPATDLGSVVTPLIGEPSAVLKRALTTLDPGEQWLLEPRVDAKDPCLWSPGVKLGVIGGSWFHQTECFGPVLGLMRADNLHHAIQLQNAVPFGLTGGIHSLDDAEIEIWKQRVQVGNAYINRPITGAIVQRQPFGGWKHSSIGPGAKAGGPNYTNLFVKIEDASEIAPDYQKWWAEYFSREHDPSGLRSESNHLRYRPCRGVIFRLDNDDPRLISLAQAAAKTCGIPLHLSLASQETETELINRLPHLASHAEFFRTVQPSSDALLTAVHNAGLSWIDAPILAKGRYELPRWLREQSVCQTLHRYGLVIRENQSPP